MQKITPFLWFDGNAEEAMNFYIATFKNAKIVSLRRNPPGFGEPGKVLTGSFEIEGQQFHVLNGGSQYKFTPAISLFINCEGQEEVDYLWDTLSEGGKKDRCGWLTDKYGLSWQVIPTALGKYMGDPNPVKAGRVMQAMMKMSKINIAELEKAHAGD